MRRLVQTFSTRAPGGTRDAWAAASMKTMLLHAGPGALTLALGVGFAGCAANPALVVQARAADDLRCSEPKITIASRPPESMFETEDAFLVEGCGEVGRYVVSFCHGLVGCTVTDAQVVSVEARKQAAFDLRCPEEDIAVVALGRDSLGARGCGRQASYALVDCGPHSLGGHGSCRVVQSTARAAPER